MELTQENYYSVEANKEYMSYSQFKQFETCEAMAIAEMNGEWQRELTDALLEGSFLEACVNGTEDDFIARFPEILSTRGKTEGLPKANFRKVYDIVEFVHDDEFFMSYLTGQQQVIMTGEINGVKYKGALDFKNEKGIVDTKKLKDFKPKWQNGAYRNIIEYWGYDIQAAIYRHLDGSNPAYYIGGVTMEKTPDHAIIEIPSDYIDVKFEQVFNNSPYYDTIKKGILKPKRCGVCDYCKSTKKLDKVISIYELEEMYR